jgi:hypothetical protein
VLNDVNNWVFWIGTLLWLLAAIASLRVGGGARRGALGHLAAGALLLVSGTLFIHVAIINAFARMDNAYLGNGFFGLYLIVAGMTLLIGALAGYGVRAWIAALLWVVTAVFGVYGVPWLAGVVRFPDSGLVLFAALLLGGVLLYVALRGYLAEAVVAVALAAAGLALVWWVYGGGTQALIPVEIIDGPVYKPPVLDFGPFLICLLVATALFFAGRLLQRRLRGQRPPAVAARVASPN